LDDHSGMHIVDVDEPPPRTQLEQYHLND